MTPYLRETLNPKAAGNLAKTQHAAMQRAAALFKAGLAARCTRENLGPKRAHGAWAPGRLFFLSALDCCFAKAFGSSSMSHT